MTKIAVSVAWGALMGACFALAMFGMGVATGHALSPRELGLAFGANLVGSTITFHMLYHSK